MRAHACGSRRWDLHSYHGACVAALVSAPSEENLSLVGMEKRSLACTYAICTQGMQWRLYDANYRSYNLFCLELPRSTAYIK